MPGLGEPYGMFAMADGNWLVSTNRNTLQLLTPAGLLTNIAGDEDEGEGFEDDKGANARFNCPLDRHHGGQRKPRPAPRVQGQRGQHAGRQRGGGLRRPAGRCRALQLPL